jgi:hypothetical protein
MSEPHLGITIEFQHTTVLQSRGLDSAILFAPRFFFGCIGPDRVFGCDVVQKPASILIQCRVFRVGPDRHVFNYRNSGVDLGHLIVLALGSGERRREIERHKIII